MGFNFFEELSSTDHEQLVFCQDKHTGLKAIIAIHNTVLGPAMGGTRMWAYEDEQSAITDALRLSRGMTFKSAIAGINVGGGKAVIIGDAKKLKSEVLMRQFGKFVHSLNGKYVTAEDVNMSEKDMEFIGMETPHVVGKSTLIGGNGDPSPVTAMTTYMGMKAAAKKAYGTDSLTGKKILVQGVGHVGTYLIENLVREGAKVMVSDIDEVKVKEVCRRFDIEHVIPVNEVFQTKCDIYAPCALGAVINDKTIPLFTCDIVAGAANNQLLDEQIHGDNLMKKGIVYAPDFLINSGGIINVYCEHIGEGKEAAMKKAEFVYDKTLEVLQTSENTQVNAQLTAMNIAQKRIQDVAHLKARM